MFSPSLESAQPIFLLHIEFRVGESPHLPKPEGYEDHTNKRWESLPGDACRAHMQRAAVHVHRPKHMQMTCHAIGRHACLHKTFPTFMSHFAVCWCYFSFVGLMGPKMMTWRMFKLHWALTRFRHRSGWQCKFCTIFDSDQIGNRRLPSCDLFCLESADVGNQCAALFHESNRMRPRHEAFENWIHVRALGGQCEQLDLEFANLPCQLCTSWADMQFAIGLDHRCVHCILRFVCGKLERFRKQKGLKLKHWKPVMDTDNKPRYFQT